MPGRIHLRSKCEDMVGRMQRDRKRGVFCCPHSLAFANWRFVVYLLFSRIKVAFEREREREREREKERERENDLMEAKKRVGGANL